MNLMRIQNFQLITFLILTHLIFKSECQLKYWPNWKNLDSRQLPIWYDNAKIGIFIHWGVYSVPSYGSEWFWYNWKVEKKPEYVRFMEKNYPPDFGYQDFAQKFTAELFDPSYWAKILSKSGARYVVVTSKHHDGYAMWPSKYCSNWNTVDVGPHRDVIGDLSNAIRNETDLHFGIYYSLYEWFNPLYLSDKKGTFYTNHFVREKVLRELFELIIRYKPDILWTDGDWEANETYWYAKELLTWLYNDSPVKNTVVANDRWGNTTRCKHGDFYTCIDRFNPGVLQSHKWENCMTLDKHSWGHRNSAELSEIYTTYELIAELVITISCGGNILINIGPMKDGIIPLIFEERLEDLGKWLAVNGEAIYESKPWIFQQDSITPGIWYTAQPRLNSVYAIILNPPMSDTLQLYYEPSLFHKTTDISILGLYFKLTWEVLDHTVQVSIPWTPLADFQHVRILKIKNIS